MKIEKLKHYRLEPGCRLMGDDENGKWAYAKTAKAREDALLKALKVARVYIASQGKGQQNTPDLDHVDDVIRQIESTK